MLTHATMQGCELTSWVPCINDKIIYNKGEKCVNKEQDLNSEQPFPRASVYRECVTLWRLILRNLECIYKSKMAGDSWHSLKIIHADEKNTGMI
jgi:hypothetical protein